MWVRTKGGALVNLGNCMGVAIPDRTDVPGVYVLRAVFSGGNTTLWRGSEGACWEVHDGIERTLEAWDPTQGGLVKLEAFVTPAGPDVDPDPANWTPEQVAQAMGPGQSFDDVEGTPA